MIGTDRCRSEPPCVRKGVPHGQTHGQTASGGIVSAVIRMLEPVHPEAVLPDRVLCLPTFSHFLIVNKLFSLTHTLSPPPPPPLLLAVRDIRRLDWPLVHIPDLFESKRARKSARVISAKVICARVVSARVMSGPSRRC